MKLRLEMETNYKSTYNSTFAEFISREQPNNDILLIEENATIPKKAPGTPNSQKSEYKKVEFEAMNSLKEHKAKLDELTDHEILDKNIRA